MQISLSDLCYQRLWSAFQWSTALGMCQITGRRVFDAKYCVASRSRTYLRELILHDALQLRWAVTGEEDPRMPMLGGNGHDLVEAAKRGS